MAKMAMRETLINLKGEMDMGRANNTSAQVMAQTLYKVLLKDKSCHGGNLIWSLPHGDEPGEWMRYSGTLVMCDSGLHLTTNIDPWLVRGCTVYEAEAEGIEDWRGDKCVCRAARLIREVPAPSWWLGVEQFIKEEIESTKWFNNDPLPERLQVQQFESWYAAHNAVFDAASYASSYAAWKAVDYAARNAARNAAWKVARNATLNAAYSAACNAARNAASDAARDAAWDAASDAALQCVMTTVCKELSIEQQYRDYAANAWGIWRAGWGLFGVIDDVYFVYKKP